MQNLPLLFFNFWYPNALSTFIRSWHNLLNVFEEDLAVGLMWKLLFTPLFHDSSFVGRILSFFFRLSRILMGLVAYLLVSLVVLVLAIFWFTLPILFFIPNVEPLSLAIKAIFLLAVFYFLYLRFSYPAKKVAHAQPSDIWQTTKLRQSDLVIEKLLKSKEVQEILFDLEVKPEVLPIQVNITPDYLSKVFSLAKKNNARFITESYFFVGFILNTPMIDTALLKLKLSTLDVENTLRFFEHKRTAYRSLSIWDEEFGVTHLKGTNRGWLGAPTPMLDSVSTDLTQEASRAKNPVIMGRETVVSEVINILSQDNNQNVMIVGPAGAGKSSLVNYLASKIISGDAPSALATKRLVSLDLSRLLAGVSTQGELAERVSGLFEEIKAIENIIIFVDEIQNLGIGEVSSSFNLYSLILPHLESNDVQFIGATEPENYARILEKNSSFARVFTKVELPPASIDETLKIVQEIAIELEKTKYIKFSFMGISHLVNYASKLMHDRVLPDSAISLLTEAQAVSTDRIINTTVVKTVLEKRVNVPIEDLGNADKSKLLKLEDLIHGKMIDQEEAVRAVSDTLRRAATSLRESNRPIGSFLFVGPTGVGKTELAKTLASVYFDQGSGNKNAPFARFDMSEYQTSEAVDRLIGSFDRPGELTEVVKNKPYSLILLDEFEKANPQILTLFLQVLDDGRLTEGDGKTIDFTNTIIIATSNAASLLIAQGIKAGKKVEDLNEVVKAELLKIYKPELINRFDEIVIFKPLSSDDLQKIVVMRLADLSKMLKEQGYLIEFDPQLVIDLGKKGFDPVLGARPLRRIIQDTLEAKLSRLILEGKLHKGEVFKADSSLITS